MQRHHIQVEANKRAARSSNTSQGSTSHLTFSTHLATATSASLAATSVALLAAASFAYFSTVSFTLQATASRQPLPTVLSTVLMNKNKSHFDSLSSTICKTKDNFPHWKDVEILRCVRAPVNLLEAESNGSKHLCSVLHQRDK